MLVNKYPERVKLPKVVFENLRYHFNKLGNYFKNGFSNKTILFFPDMPSKKSVIYKIAQNLNYNITNNPKQKRQIAICWEDSTFKTDHSDKIQAEKKINFSCLDISKIKVDAVFKSVFQYSTFVDPLNHKGKLVQKSDINAKHDGLVLDGPLSAKEISDEYVYQIVIDNTVDDLVMDYRTPVFNGSIPFVYKKYRPQTERFSNTNSQAEMAETSEIFNPKEIQLIKKFCVEMKLNYGELDILRDKTSSKIYIIDVNTTPWGPPNHLKKEEIKKAVQVLASEFKKTFLA